MLINTNFWINAANIIVFFFYPDQGAISYVLSNF